LHPGKFLDTSLCNFPRPAGSDGASLTRVSTGCLELFSDGFLDGSLNRFPRTTLRWIPWQKSQQVRKTAFRRVPGQESLQIPEYNWIQLVSLTGMSVDSKAEPYPDGFPDRSVSRLQSKTASRWVRWQE
jgi:hypothetical protein